MNKVEIDVLSKNTTGNKYIEVISNYRIAVDNYHKKSEVLEQKLEEITSEVPIFINRNLCLNNSINKLIVSSKLSKLSTRIGHFLCRRPSKIWKKDFSSCKKMKKAMIP